jgi:hypothetical protein
VVSQLPLKISGENNFSGEDRIRMKPTPFFLLLASHNKAKRVEIQESYGQFESFWVIHGEEMFSSMVTEMTPSPESSRSIDWSLAVENLSMAMEGR